MTAGKRLEIQKSVTLQSPREIFPAKMALIRREQGGDRLIYRKMIGVRDGVR